ncbi:hypothetical protein J6590_033904 [Homalodisca vitripennis]|nr:hypothetical protein J6590_033904 [Homalodisca vitripennis]
MVRKFDSMWMLSLPPFHIRLIALSPKFFDPFIRMWTPDAALRGSERGDSRGRTPQILNFQNCINIMAHTLTVFRQDLLRDCDYYNPLPPPTIPPPHPSTQQCKHIGHTTYDARDHTTVLQAEMTTTSNIVLTYPVNIVAMRLPVYRLANLYHRSEQGARAKYPLVVSREGKSSTAPCKRLLVFAILGSDVLTFIALTARNRVMCKNSFKHNARNVYCTAAEICHSCTVHSDREFVRPETSATRARFTADRECVRPETSATLARFIADRECVRPETSAIRARFTADRECVRPETSSAFARFTADTICVQPETSSAFARFTADTICVQPETSSTLARFPALTE